MVLRVEFVIVYCDVCLPYSLILSDIQCQIVCGTVSDCVMYSVRLSDVQCQTVCCTVPD